MHSTTRFLRTGSAPLFLLLMGRGCDHSAQVLSLEERPAATFDSPFDATSDIGILKGDATERPAEDAAEDALEGAPTSFRIHFLVAGPSATEGDQLLAEHLSASGYDVVLATDLSALDTASRRTGVVVSSSAESSQLGDQLRNVSVPVAVLESWLLGYMGMTGSVRFTDYGVDSDQSSLVIAPGSAPFSVPASAKSEVYTQIGWLNWGRVPGAAGTLATVTGHSEHAAVFAYSPGGMMAGGIAAPAKRLALFLRTEYASQLTPAGWQLVDSAFDWLSR